MLGLARSGRDVFESGLGELFVIRVAGNIVAPPRSERRVRRGAFGTRLVVVMGIPVRRDRRPPSSDLQWPRRPGLSQSQLSIVDRVRPNIEALVSTDLDLDPVRLRREAMRANVRASVNHLRYGSEVIERLVDRRRTRRRRRRARPRNGRGRFFDDGLP